MEQNIKLDILKSIGEVYEQSEECKLTSAHFEKISDELNLLSDYFGTSKSQSFFIAMVFTLNWKGDSVDINDLISYFDCNPMRVLEFRDDFDFLYSKGILKKEKSRHRMKFPGANDQFIVNEKISDAILQNKPMPELHTGKIHDIIELLEKFYTIRDDDDEMSTDVVFLHAKDMIDVNQHFPLIKKVTQFNYNINETYLFLCLVWKTMSGSETIGLSRILEEIYTNSSRRLNYMQAILSEQNPLIKNNLVALEAASFFNDTEVKLTDQSLNLLNDCGIKLFSKKKKQENIITPSEIPLRKLIFNEAEMQQLTLLKNLLGENSLSSVQNRLLEKGLPQGVTALLYGAPGTGKTETVKQLAKDTNREIMKVEISQSKSMWFGQSEKLIKRIFTDYKSFAEGCERTPILLFNEADAIISKRRDIGSSSVAQTENTIQNIILEELENFEGILIATTNLANNLDSAFERRFLFKIKFQKPDSEIKAQIWKDKLSFLTHEQCQQLALQFDFSGGQIDNILRKSEIHEIIHGDTLTFKHIIDFSKEEVLGDSRVKIGFSK